MKKKDSKPRIKGSREKIALIVNQPQMTFKDLQRRAIVLGMPFPDVPNSDYNDLVSFITHSENKPDPTLIDQYDEWMDKVLEERGYSKNDPMRSYQLRLGFVSEDAITKQKTTKRVKGIPKPKKPKKEKNELGLWKGTKKAYTFELTLKGYDLERVTRRVLKHFPEANEKSIKQWYKAALKSK